MISNKKRWLIIIFSSVIICSVFSIIYFILTNNKKEIIYEQEYEVKDNVFIKEVHEITHDELIKTKILINNKLMFEIDGEVYIEEDSFILTKNDFVFELYEIAEGTSYGYYLIYNNYKNYMNLNMLTEKVQVNKVEVNNNEFTINSSVPFIYGNWDILCLNYKEDDIVLAIEKFEYLGNGKFSNVTFVSKKTLLETLKNNTNYTGCKSVLSK